MKEKHFNDNKTQTLIIISWDFFSLLHRIDLKGGFEIRVTVYCYTFTSSMTTLNYNVSTNFLCWNLRNINQWKRKKSIIIHVISNLYLSRLDLKNLSASSEENLDDPSPIAENSKYSTLGWKVLVLSIVVFCLNFRLVSKVLISKFHSFRHQNQ